MPDIFSFPELAVLVQMVVFLVSIVLFYGLIRAAVVGALRDHHKWVERRVAKMAPPESAPSQSWDLPFGHRP